MALSLLPAFMSEISQLQGFSRSVNCGVYKVQFMSLVRVDSRLRAMDELPDVARLDGAVHAEFRTTVEIEE